jgi:DNA-binding winged helix-turn-helix (wHTH) protein
MPGTKREIGDFELDLGRFELRRQGRRVRLEKKPMELLIFLLARREQLVSRQDIITKLWRSDLFVDAEANINNVIRKIRTALGDSHAKPHFLETVVGKGYRFIGPMRVIDAGFPHSNFEQTPVGHAHRWRVPAGEERTTLAVLPLCLLGTIPDDKGVCLGFADALVSRLGNLRDVDVLPTSSMLNVPAEMSASDVGSSLGVRFVVHGAIRESKANGASLWKCSTRTYGVQGSHGSATSIWIDYQNLKMKLPNASPLHCTGRCAHRPCQAGAIATTSWHMRNSYAATASALPEILRCWKRQCNG